MREFWSAAICVALLLDGSAAHAADSLDVASVREHVRAARGTRPAAERTTLGFVAFGLHGTRTTIRREADVRETVVDGPFATASGSFHGQAWHQNANGQTVLDEPDPGRAAGDTYVTTMAAIAVPVAGYAISSLDKRGRGTVEFIEASTWHIVRRDVIGAAETTTYAYDDFRTVGGYTKPWHWTTRDGHHENDSDDRILSYDAGPVTDGDLAIPSSRRNLVEFPAGKTSVALPVREDRGKFIVRVNVGSRGLDFGLDTGAGTIVIDDSVVRELALKTYGTTSNGANVGRFVSTSAIVPEMKIGDLTLRDVVVDTIPHLGSDRDGTYKMVGLLGFDFIASLVLQMDYERGQVTAIDPAAFAPPKDPLTNALAVRLGSDSPMTDVTVNGVVAERFLLDTGAAGSVFIFDYFKRRNPEALSNGNARALAGRTFLGVGGSFETKRYRLKSVKLGRVDFKDFEADVVESASVYGGRDDGVIGSDFLSLYTVFTDYPDSMVYLVPNARGRAAIER